MPEKPLTDRALAALREAGCWAFKVWGNGVQEAGVPDIVGCWPVVADGDLVAGLFFALESKDGKHGVVEPIQEYQLRLIAEAGGTGLVVRDDAQLAGAMEYLRRKATSVGEAIEWYGDLPEIDFSGAQAQ